MSMIMSATSETMQKTGISEMYTITNTGHKTKTLQYYSTKPVTRYTEYPQNNPLQSILIDINAL